MWGWDVNTGADRSTGEDGIIGADGEGDVQGYMKLTTSLVNGTPAHLIFIFIL